MEHRSGRKKSYRPAKRDKEAAITVHGLLLACQGLRVESRRLVPSRRKSVRLGDATYCRDASCVSGTRNARGNGFARRAWKPGADDVAKVPEPPEEVVFWLLGSVQRRFPVNFAGFDGRSSDYRFP